jgi:hypothetical protein
MDGSIVDVAEPHPEDEREAPARQPVDATRSGPRRRISNSRKPQNPTASATKNQRANPAVCEDAEGRARLLRCAAEHRPDGYALAEIQRSRDHCLADPIGRGDQRGGSSH